MERLTLIKTFIGLLFCLQMQAQPQTKSILGIEDADMVERLMPIVPGVGSFGKGELSEQSIKPYMMPVRQVAANGSSESYLLASCLEYYVNLNKNYNVNLSPDYISLNLQSQGKTADFKGAFQQMSETGTVSAAIMPYGSNQITAAVYATQKFRISNYLILFREVTRERQKIYEIRKALVRGNPVIVEINAATTLKNAFSKSTMKLSGQGDQKYAFLVVGFDHEKEAFELMSPWGSGWGKGGYLWISYDDLARHANIGYVMVPDVQF